MIHRHLFRQRTLEQLESRHCLSGASFVEHEVYDTLEHPLAELVDIDADGDLDVLAASEYRGEIRWYENRDRNGDFGTFRLVEAEEEFRQIYLIEALDFDNDGDVDIVTDSEGKAGRLLVWYENTDGKGSFAPSQRILGPNNNANPVALADLDADGDMDVISVINSVYWLEQTGDQSFRWHPVKQSGVHGALVRDFDGDGDLDIATWNEATWEESGRISIFTNSGFGEFAERDGSDIEWPAIDGRVYNGRIFAVDVDGDHDLDLAVVGRDETALYENVGGHNRFEFMSTFAAENVSSLFPLDVDRDGDLDLLMDAGYEFVWYRNSDGNGTYEPGGSIDSGFDVNSIQAGDIDSDGDSDLVVGAASCDLGNCVWNFVNWYENTGSVQPFSEPVNLLPPSIGYIDSRTGPQAIDMDADGDLDVFVSRESWLKNLGNGEFQLELFSSLAPPSWTRYNMIPSDMDGDGDMDFVYTTYSSEAGWTIEWAEMSYGEMHPSDLHTVASTNKSVSKLLSVDFDQDNDQDLFSLQYESEPVFSFALMQHENIDGQGTFREPKIVYAAEASANVKPFDFDVDGDTDLVVVQGNQVFWMENRRGQFENPTSLFTTSHRIDQVELADLDGDHDVDVIVLTRHFTSGEVAWFENPNEGNVGWNESVIRTFEHRRVFTLETNDFDADGDVDILLSDAIFDAGYFDGELSWLENVNGQGDFSEVHSIAQSAHSGIYAESDDFDGDGDTDIMAVLSSTEIVFLENEIRPIIGDANYDGVFNSSDLVKVFQAGEYEDEIAGNSTFEEGDWNNDGEFNSTDLVAAFQAGTYQANA
ncbi:MAG: VCBS repeat-containing protein, partial [Planctomycetales bacterium]|nr:VCBS repeat-containing protein [Planctomycetales bacterium]